MTVSYNCLHCDHELVAKNLNICKIKMLLHLRFDSCYNKLHKNHWIRAGTLPVLKEVVRLWWKN